MPDLFRIRDHVADFDAVVSEIIGRSAATRQTLPMTADIPYGSESRETVDIFFPAVRNSAMPVHMFIHGGYWRMFSKRDYSCIADTVTAAGAIAIIVDYSLMPSVRMATIVDQVRRARDWVVTHVSEYGGDPGKLTVSGHSAGAHLASHLFTLDHAPGRVRGALLLGGLYELDPLRHSFLQSEIGLTDEEVAEFTPMSHQYETATRVNILVGADETPPFHTMADAFAALLHSQGLTVSRANLSARNHMDSVLDLAIADTDAHRFLAALLRET